MCGEGCQCVGFGASVKGGWRGVLSSDWPPTRLPYPEGACSRALRDLFDCFARHSWPVPTPHLGGVSLKPYTFLALSPSHTGNVALSPPHTTHVAFFPPRMPRRPSNPYLSPSPSQLASHPLPTHELRCRPFRRRIRSPTSTYTYALFGSPSDPLALPPPNYALSTQ